MKKVYKYLITVGVGLLLAAWVAFSKNIFAQTSISLIFAILSDAFLVPGILITGMGGLIFVSNEGMFDAFSYGMTSFIDLFRKEKRNKYHTFYDYKQSKADRDRSFGFLLICGLAFLALSGIMLWLFTKNV